MKELERLNKLKEENEKYMKKKAEDDERDREIKCMAQADNEAKIVEGFLQRMVQERESQKVIKQLKSMKKLHQRFEEDFKETVVQSALEKRKKTLEDIRNFHKPIQKEDFEDHEDNYHDIKMKKLEEIKKKREKEFKEREKHFKSLKYQPHLDENQRNKEYVKIKKELREQKLKKKEVLETKNNYAKYVREMYWP